MCPITIARIAIVAGIIAISAIVNANEEAARSAPPATLKLVLQHRDPATGTPVVTQVELAPQRLSVVVVDVWTQHYCKGVTSAAQKMIPAWNEFLDASRALGIPVIFAASGDDLMRWQGKPERTGITSLPKHPLPKSNEFLADHGMFGPWPASCMCRIHKIKADGSPVYECSQQPLVTTQSSRLVVKDGDLFIAAGHYGPAVTSAISSWGEPAQQELWNFTQEKQITHLIYIGDSTNMCVINREFAMIQARRMGLQPILVRDLTNSQTFDGYNPDTRRLDPAITPAVGTAKGVEYIEQKIGSSIDSGQILNAAR